MTSLSKVHTLCADGVAETKGSLIVLHYLLFTLDNGADGAAKELFLLESGSYV